MAQTSLAKLERTIAQVDRPMPPFERPPVAATIPTLFYTSVDPVTVDIVHAALLNFPEVARLLKELQGWVQTSYT